MKKIEKTQNLQQIFDEVKDNPIIEPYLGGEVSKPTVIGCYGVKKGCAYPNCDCQQPKYQDAVNLAIDKIKEFTPELGVKEAADLYVRALLKTVGNPQHLRTSSTIRDFKAGANWQATQQQGLESIVGFVLEWVAERAGTKPDGDFGRDGEYYEREIIDKEGILIMKADIIKELTQLKTLKQ